MFIFHINKPFHTSMISVMGLKWIVRLHGFINVSSNEFMYDWIVNMALYRSWKAGQFLKNNMNQSEVGRSPRGCDTPCGVTSDNQHVACCYIQRCRTLTPGSCVRQSGVWLFQRADNQEHALGRSNINAQNRSRYGSELWLLQGLQLARVKKGR